MAPTRCPAEAETIPGRRARDGPLRSVPAPGPRPAAATSSGETPAAPRPPLLHPAWRPPPRPRTPAPPGPSAGTAARPGTPPRVASPQAAASAALAPCRRRPGGGEQSRAAGRAATASTMEPRGGAVTAAAASARRGLRLQLASRGAATGARLQLYSGTAQAHLPRPAPRGPGAQGPPPDQWGGSCTEGRGWEKQREVGRGCGGGTEEQPQLRPNPTQSQEAVHYVHLESSQQAVLIPHPALELVGLAGSPGKKLRPKARPPALSQVTQSHSFIHLVFIQQTLSRLLGCALGMKRRHARRSLQELLRAGP